MKQMIWSSQDLLDETAKEYYQDSQREILDDDCYEVSDEEWTEEVYRWLDDERSNLNKEVDGIIVVFGNLGLWNGRRQGYQILGSNIADILKSQCDEAEGEEKKDIRANETKANLVCRLLLDKKKNNL